jgi:ABC-type spermidine/putrescine transport system permease subunit II
LRGFLSIIKEIALHFARKEFCRKAINERADLSVFKEKSSFSVKIGIILVFFSYIIGLPAVFAIGALAAALKKPLIFLIGGPLIYSISTLIFILGGYLAGTKYIKAFFRWSVRIILEKILGDEAKKQASLNTNN